MEAHISTIQLKGPVSPEQLAREVLSHHPVIRMPIPIAMIATQEGAEVRYRHIVPHGGLSFTPHGYVITVNAALSDQRQRFTIAHELGRLLLDRDYRRTRQQRACVTTDYRLGGVSHITDEERLCDVFANHLLIPQEAHADLDNWEAISIPALVRRARSLHLSPITLAWRVVECAPHSAGILVFRTMGKPTAPDNTRLRLDWGRFPKEQRIYLPRYDVVPNDSPIHQALGCRSQLFLPCVKLNFGSLRGVNSLLVAEIGRLGEDMLLAIVLPREEEIQLFQLYHTPHHVSYSSSCIILLINSPSGILLMKRTARTHYGPISQR
jgi:hypothetical protein